MAERLTAERGHIGGVIMPRIARSLATLCGNVADMLGRKYDNWPV